jgi:hypothetical protein
VDSMGRQNKERRYTTSKVDFQLVGADLIGRPLVGFSEQALCGPVRTR